MKLSDFRKIVHATTLSLLQESNDLALALTGVGPNGPEKVPTTAQEFMKKLVGKKLKDLLDATSFSRLYVLNKYGVGSSPDDEDIQVSVTNLMDAATGFINRRFLGPIGKQRSAWEKEKYSTPEYNDWNKQRNAAFKAVLMARRTGDKAEIDKAEKHKNDVNAADPTFGDYKQMMSDMDNVVKQFHNKPLVLADVLPGPDDTEEDKKNWQSVENAFNALKKASSLKEQESMGKNYPAVKVFVSTVGGGVHVLLWKQQNFDKEVGSDANVKTYGNLASLIRNLRVDPSKLMSSDRNAVEILKFLSSDELRQLANKESVITTNIPPDVVDKFSTNQPLQENQPMTQKQKLKQIIRAIVAEDFKGEPNHAAEVESDNLTATLSETDTAANIADLEKLIANPDAAFAKKNYGSVEAYQKMLRKKIARLKGDEPGMGPEYRVRSDEPAPFGYGLDEKESAKKVTSKALDQTKDGTIDAGDAVVAARKEKIALSKGDKSDAAFYKKIKAIVNKRKGSKV